MYQFPRNGRAYLRSLLGAVAIFLFILAVDAVLTNWGLHLEATYLDECLVAIAVGLLIFTLEWWHEADLRAERELTLLLLGLNHHITNAVQSILDISSSVADERQSQALAEAASRIEWVVREVSHQALTNSEEEKPLHVEPWSPSQ